MEYPLDKSCRTVAILGWLPQNDFESLPQDPGKFPAVFGWHRPPILLRVLEKRGESLDCARCKYQQQYDQDWIYQK